MKLFLVFILFFSYLYAQKTDFEQYEESLKKNDLKNAKIYLLKSLNQSFEKANLTTVQQRYYQMGSLYKKTKEYYKSIQYYKLSLKLELSKSKIDAMSLIKIYKNLSFCYSKIGNNFKTFKYSYKAVELSNKKFGKNSKISKKLTKEVAKVQSKLIANSI